MRRAHMSHHSACATHCGTQQAGNSPDIQHFVLARGIKIMGRNLEYGLPKALNNDREV